MEQEGLSSRLNFFKDITFGYNLILPNSYIYIGQKHKWNLMQMIKLWQYYLYSTREPFINLYFHFPFCFKQRCSYCLYNSSVLESKEQVDSYLDYLEKMMNFYSNYFSKIKFETLYIGGGTPSIMTEQQLEDFFKKINKYFKLEFNKEHTIEISPLTVTRDKIDICKQYGINRVSMGIQTFNGDILKEINRIGNLSWNGIKSLINYIQDKRFEDFNVDLIAGLPGETPESILDNIKKILSLGVPSVTIYKYQHNYRDLNKNVSEYYTNQYLIFYPKLYKEIVILMERYGYLEKTKKSDMMPLYIFVKKGHQTKKDYFLAWESKNNNSILGIGRGAENSIGNKIFANEKFDLHSSNLTIEKTEFEGFILSKDDRIRNYVIFELWWHGQINIKEFFRMFKEDFIQYFKEELSYLQTLNKIKIKDDIAEFKVENILDFAVYIKFFFNLNYLLTNYIAR